MESAFPAPFKTGSKSRSGETTATVAIRLQLRSFGQRNAIALDFFRHDLPRAGREPVAREKFRPVRHGKQARDFAAARRVHRRFHQAVADVAALPARIGSDRERANFGKVGAVRFERDAAQNFFLSIALFHEHEETRDMLADFRLGARKQQDPRRHSARSRDAPRPRRSFEPCAPS